MPKGDPNGGRPRRIEKANEDRLRAVLVELGYSPRRVLPRLVPALVDNRDSLLDRWIDKYPDLDAAALRVKFENAAVDATIIGVRAGHALKDDPAAVDAFQRWLAGGRRS